jgi:hypothetical protein
MISSQGYIQDGYRSEAELAWNGCDSATILIWTDLPTDLTWNGLEVYVIPLGVRQGSFTMKGAPSSPVLSPQPSMPLYVVIRTMVASKVVYRRPPER